MLKRFYIRSQMYGQMWYLVDCDGPTAEWTRDIRDASGFATKETIEQFAALVLKRRNFPYEIVEK